MRLTAVSILLAAAASGDSASAVPPVIAPDGVVNAASYIPRGFSNHGIARGSLFLIFGDHLGPDTLVQAVSYPLTGADGLAGTRVRIDTEEYSSSALMVYTSSKQVAAILPSSAPEGNGTLTLTYNNVTSNPVPVRIVRSALGIFTQNMGGTGPAVVQNLVSSTQTALNTLIASAAPGQIEILWGTGLGPVTGNEAGGPLPGGLPYLDSMLVGGQPAHVRYAGRSGCCAGIDQITFDVPAGVSGCYVPVAAITGGVVSNFGTISVSTSGSECDDPLTFRASGLVTVEQTGRLRLGTIEILHETPVGQTVGSNSLMASFLSYTTAALLTALPQPFNIPVGSCLLSQSAVGSGLPASGDPLNAGGALDTTGPGVDFMAGSASPGIYSVGPVQGSFASGTYDVTGPGGPDVGAFLSTFSENVPVVWTNASDFLNRTVALAQPMTFSWTGGDAEGYVRIRIASANGTLASSIFCNAPTASGRLTVPAYLTAGLIPGAGTVEVGSTGNRIPFSAPGLDVGTVAAESSTEVQTNFQMHSDSGN